MSNKLFSLLAMVMVLSTLVACGKEVEVTRIVKKTVAETVVVTVTPVATQPEVVPTPTSTVGQPSPTVTPMPVATRPKGAPPAYWPTKGWLTSAPEEQGMDSKVLLAMLERVQEYNPGIGSILVVRNGYLVLEAYYPSFAADVTQNIHSCTKSITSALIGIAIDQGYIESVEQSVLDFFPGRTFAHMDEDKEAITIGDLLTMRPGLECIITDREVTLEQMQNSPDWVQFFLDLPMMAEPGTEWTYCSPASYILSVILQEATGMSTLEFAQENLFDPLGIADVVWASGPQDYHTGWGNIHLRSRDMAKFGYLYLHGGEWDGQQIVSTQWATEATRSHVAATKFRRGYGYQWWVDDGSHYYLAMGHYGQFIIVVPDLNMVIVFTGYLPGSVAYHSLSLVGNYILPAAVSETALPENPDAATALVEHIEGLNQPSSSQPVPPLPEMAHQISGQTYTCPQDESGRRIFSFVFSEGDDVAVQFVEFMAEDDPVIENHIGLDDVYRYSLDEGDGNEYLFHSWLKGFWESDNEFVITGLTRWDHPYEGFPRQFWCSYVFENDQVAYSCGGEESYPRGRMFVQTCIAQSDE